ncbi:MAG: hypothetical protein D6805_01240 [Planctomycetota bacterium]|nr:MAG: hypothetical protein D6805_01240 [Planctomycetota bacterium]
MLSNLFKYFQRLPRVFWMMGGVAFFFFLLSGVIFQSFRQAGLQRLRRLEKERTYLGRLEVLHRALTLGDSGFSKSQEFLRRSIFDSAKFLLDKNLPLAKKVILTQLVEHIQQKRESFSFSHEQIQRKLAHYRYQLRKEGEGYRRMYRRVDFFFFLCFVLALFVFLLWGGWGVYWLVRVQDLERAEVRGVVQDFFRTLPFGFVASWPSMGLSNMVQDLEAVCGYLREGFQNEAQKTLRILEDLAQLEEKSKRDGKSLLEKDAKIRQLSKERHELALELERKSALVRDLRRRLKACALQNQEVGQGGEEELLQELQRLQDQKVILCQQLQELRERVQQLQQERELWQERQRHFRLKEVEAAQELQDAQAHISILEKKIHFLQNELGDYRKEVERLSQKIEFVQKSSYSPEKLEALLEKIHDFGDGLRRVVSTFRSSPEVEKLLEGYREILDYIESLDPFLVQRVGSEDVAGLTEQILGELDSLIEEDSGSEADCSLKGEEDRIASMAVEILSDLEEGSSSPEEGDSSGSVVSAASSSEVISSFSLYQLLEEIEGALLEELDRRQNMLELVVPRSIQLSLDRERLHQLLLAMIRYSCRRSYGGILLLEAEERGGYVELTLESTGAIHSATELAIFEGASSLERFPPEAPVVRIVRLTRLLGIRFHTRSDAQGTALVLRIPKPGKWHKEEPAKEEGF